MSTLINNEIQTEMQSKHGSFRYIKRRVLGASGVAIFVMTTLNQIGAFQICGVMDYSMCTDSIHTLTVSLLPSIPLFLFSLLTYPLSDVLYEKWWRFVRLSIPIMMLLIFLAPRQSTDWMFPLEQGGIALFMVALFVLGSLHILYSTYKSLQE